MYQKANSIQPNREKMKTIFNLPVLFERVKNRTRTGSIQIHKTREGCTRDRSQTEATKGCSEGGTEKKL